MQPRGSSAGKHFRWFIYLVFILQECLKILWNLNSTVSLDPFLRAILLHLSFLFLVSAICVDILFEEVIYNLNV